MIIAYLKHADPYSVRLRVFLERKGVSFEEKDEDDLLAVDASLTCPQLFVDGRLIGDYERVTSLDLRGELEDILKQ